MGAPTGRSVPGGLRPLGLGIDRHTVLSFVPVARHRPRMPVAPIHCVRTRRSTLCPLAGRCSLHRQDYRWPGPSRLLLADVVRCHIVSAHRATADQAPHPICASPSLCCPSLNDPIFLRPVLLFLVVEVVLQNCGAYSLWPGWSAA